MKKIILLYILMVFSIAGVGYSLESKNDIALVSKLIHTIYKEKTKTFAKYQCKDNRENTLNYYKNFFTNQTASLLSDIVEKEKTRSGQGAFIEDPRFSDDLNTGDPEEPWLSDADRIIKKIWFATPTIQKDEATICVDSLVESKKGQMMRSEFHLMKTPTGWKIDNIIWGPKGEFEEGSTLGLRSIH